MNVPGFLARIPGSDADAFRWFPYYTLRAIVHSEMNPLKYTVMSSAFSHKVTHTVQYFPM
jgi:hypothetical protein